MQHVHLIHTLNSYKSPFIALDEIKGETSKDFDKEEEIETTRINTDHKPVSTEPEQNSSLSEAAMQITEEEEKYQPIEQGIQSQGIEGENQQQETTESKLDSSLDKLELEQTADHEEKRDGAQISRKIYSGKRNTCTLTDLSEKFTQEKDATKSIHRRSWGDLPDIDKIPQQHKNLIMEKSKKQLLDKLEINHGIQIQELVAKLEEQKLQEIEKIQKKYQESRENIETEMQDSCINKDI